MIELLNSNRIDEINISNMSILSNKLSNDLHIHSIKFLQIDNERSIELKFFT